MELGARNCTTGEAYAVKVVAALAMVDGGEMDWKLLGVRADDPLAARVESLADLERELPGQVDALQKWLLAYKEPGEVEFCAPAARDAAEAAGVLERYNKEYEDVLSGAVPNDEELALPAAAAAAGPAGAEAAAEAAELSPAVEAAEEKIEAAAISGAARVGALAAALLALSAAAL
jgi:inorganic pyrophosphatase